MKRVILIEDVEKLGSAGDVIVVKDGYARNFLVPRKKAQPATPQNMKLAEAVKKKKEEGLAKVKDEALALAKELSSVSCTINMAAGEDDKLFGSVTSDIIAKTLETSGFRVDKRDIILEEPIRKLGVYQVEVRVHPEVKTNLKVWVVKE